MTKVWRRIKGAAAALMVCLPLAIPGEAAQATRSFSTATYDVNQAVDVTINVQPGAAASAYVVSDKLPSNWQFVGSGAGIVGFDAANQMVKFGPYLNNQARSLAYRALPVAAPAPGTIERFAGEISVDGGKSMVSGASWVAQSVVAPPGIDEGLALWMKLDSDAWDTSGNGRHGTLNTTGTTFQTGARGSALKFSRASTNIIVLNGPDFIPGTNSLAIATFFKIDSFSDFPSHENKQISLLYAATDYTGISDDSYALGLVLEGQATKVRFWVADVDGRVAWVEPNASFPLGIWNHVYAVADRATGDLSVYMNGTNVNATVKQGYSSFSVLGSIKPAKAIQVGNMAYGPGPRHWGVGSFAHGAALDDYRIYSRALTASERSYLRTTFEAPSALIPQSAVEVMEGDLVVLQSEVSGVPEPSYQWQMAAQPGSEWVDVQDGAMFSGVLTESLRIAEATLAQDRHQFRVRVSNPQGTNVSNTAILTVIPTPRAPSITLHPLEKRIVATQSARFEAMATGVPIPALTWQRSIDGGSSWISLANTEVFSGVTSTNLALDSVTEAMHGHQFRLRAGNSAGTNFSAAATLFVLIAPDVVVQPIPAPFRRGFPASISCVTVGRPAPALTWQRSVDGGVNWSSLAGVGGFSGANSGTLEIMEVTSAMEGHQFRVLAANEAGTVASGVATIELDNRFAGQVVAAWGLNNRGQTNVPAGLAGVRQVALGENHTLVLMDDGGVRGWGLNQQRQLEMPAGLRQVVEVAAGAGHSIALRSDGTLVAWGHTQYGTITIPAGVTNVAQIAAAGWHNVALKRDGTVAAWGYNLYNQTVVPPGLSGVVRVAAGRLHSLALLGDGRVVSWGRKDEGQLPPATLPQKVKGIAGGWMHTLLLMEDGTVRAYGLNSSGQATVPAGLTDVVQVAAGGDFSMALTRAGRVVVWGGKPEIQESQIPPMVVDYTSVVAGGGHAAVLGAPNAAPSVQLLASLSSVPQGHPVVLRVVASDPEGELARIEIFNQDGVKVGELTKPPHIVILENLGLGSHRFKAKATDRNGLSSLSGEVPVTIASASNAVSATHVSTGYMLDGTVLIDVTVYHTGVPSALGYEAEFEDGWEYIQDNSAGATVKPVRRQQGELEWIWTTPPSNPVRFRIEARAPFGTFGNPIVRGAAHAFFQGSPASSPAFPNPLTLEELLIRHHSVDYSRSWSFELDELLRMVSLFNYSENSRRTGEYHWRLGTEDGYAPGMGDQSRRPHTADTDENWRFSLLELLRVVSLFNYTENNIRTGSYHLSGGGIDGYASGRGVGPLAVGGESIVRSAAAEGAEIIPSSVSFSTGQVFEFTLKSVYGGDPSAFGWEVVLPEGWSYVDDDSAANVKPSSGQQGALGWAWFSAFPPSNTEFRVRVLPAVAGADISSLTARAMVREPLRIIESNVLNLSRAQEGVAPISISSAKPGEIVVNGVAGRRYIIQSATDLGRPDWTEVGAIVLDGQGGGRFLDEGATTSQTRFYRVLLAQ